MDITERKANEEAQRNRMLEAEQRRVEAEEAKRQQELLIDITSCGLLNPSLVDADTQARDPQSHQFAHADKFSPSREAFADNVLLISC